MSKEVSPSAVSVEEFNEYIADLGFIDVAPIVEQVSQDRVLIRVPTAEVQLRRAGTSPGQR